jgi:hypothetical protein
MRVTPFPRDGTRMPSRSESKSPDRFSSGHHHTYANNPMSRTWFYFSTKSLLSTTVRGPTVMLPYQATTGRADERWRPADAAEGTNRPGGLDENTTGYRLDRVIRLVISPAHHSCTPRITPPHPPAPRPLQRSRSIRDLR